MRKSIACFVVLACGCAWSSAEAAYVIKLKNGNEFVTARYWHEGRQVMFDTYGGVFGVDKAFVVKIEQSDKPVKLISSPIEPPAVTTPPGSDKEGSGSKKASQGSEAPAKARPEDDPIMKDFYALKEKFAGLDSMLTSEMIEFSKELNIFKRKVQSSGKTNDYLSEFTEVFKMGNALEAILKARGQ